MDVGRNFQLQKCHWRREVDILEILHVAKDFLDPLWLEESNDELYVRREIYTGRYQLSYIYSALLSELPWVKVVDTWYPMTYICVHPPVQLTLSQYLKILFGLLLQHINIKTSPPNRYSSIHQNQCKSLTKHWPCTKMNLTPVNIERAINWTSY